MVHHLTLQCIFNKNKFEPIGCSTSDMETSFLRLDLDCALKGWLYVLMLHDMFIGNAAFVILVKKISFALYSVQITT